MNRRNAAISTVVLILIVGAAWAFGFFGRTDPAVAELQQMRDQMFASRDLPEAQRDQLRDQFRQRLEGLSDAQRRAVFAGGREQWQQRNQQRMDQFFAMSRADQQKRLDESINRMLERQKDQNQNGAGNRNARSGGNGGRGGDRGRNMTPAQRESRAKQRLDRSSPKERAQRDEFRRRMQERMQQRGINPQLLPGPGGRRMA
jgi:hypothetical protein